MATSSKITERIGKRLSRNGICSRREAERWISQGRISVDGIPITSPNILVNEKTIIFVDGKKINTPEKTRLWLYHKPRGIICTTNDPEKRPTVFERLPPELPRTILVGRLDLTSEGLLLLTNDGNLSRMLELPSTGCVRKYRVRVFGRPKTEQLNELKNGISISGMTYYPILAHIDSSRGRNTWITMSLVEGKNREIRRVMEHLGLKVTRLIRTGYGPFKLGTVVPDATLEINNRMLAKNIKQIKVEAERLRNKTPNQLSKKFLPSKSPKHADNRW